MWTIEAIAWADANGNGRRDNNESSLQGVRFEVLHTNKTPTGMRAVGDAQGRATFKLFGGCSPTPFVVVATPLPGYQLTTPDHVSKTGQGTVAFGFAAR